MAPFLTRLPRLAKVLILVAVDGLIGVAALWGAVFLRHGTLGKAYANHALELTLLALLLVPAVGLACGLYRSVVRFAMPSLSLRAALAALLCGAVIMALGIAGGAQAARAGGLGAVFALVLFALQVGSRRFARRILRTGSSAGRRVAIYGAGAAGQQLVAVMRGAADFAPVLFLDDDPSLHGRMVDDLLVADPRGPKLAALLRARGVEEILLAVPSLPASRRRAILERLAELPYRVRTVPGLAELVAGREPGRPAGIGDVRDVSVEDLLGRDPVAPLPGLLDKCIRGKAVLVTGGGGSIGAELCRQVLTLGPARLVVLENSEFALYRIEEELRAFARAGGAQAELRFVLGSVTDAARIAALFDEAQLETVYHAAAYKHVPIVEANPLEGLRNNVLGTWNVALASARARAGHFILVSTDKAVRPTSVMGATKRMAELVVQVLAAKHPKTVFSMVRFGNVLESSGSVVPLFRRQIEAGGPVTVTHPDVSRYFMTIQEAVALVIQAGAMAAGGEVFVLDMGAPVRIMDLAQRMIRLSGRSVRDEQHPGGEIGIETVGLRPGEKLYEELLISGAATGTAHPRIFLVREQGADAQQFEAEMEALQRDPGDVREVLARWVTGYASAARPPAAVAPLRLAS